jgi:CTP synthase
VFERHRHRYEFNNEYRKRMEANGVVVSGRSADNSLVEIIELADHPWFVATQFHPEFKSRPNRPHPLFRDFIGASTRLAQEKLQGHEGTFEQEASVGASAASAPSDSRTEK